MKKVIAIFGLVVVLLTAIVSAIDVSVLRGHDLETVVDWADTYGYATPTYEVGWKALVRKYELSLFTCDYVQPATEYRSERVFKAAGYVWNNAECRLITSKKLTPSVPVVVPVEVEEEEEPVEEPPVEEELPVEEPVEEPTLE